MSVVSRIAVVVVTCLAADLSGQASEAATLPVREVVVFKDGHAFVMREGQATPDDQGRVVLEELPIPIMGTFWPYATQKDVKLVSVVGGRTKKDVERTALDASRLIKGNIGAEVFVTVGTTRLAGVIFDAPLRSSEELVRTSPPGAAEGLPLYAPFFLLKTADGIRLVHYDQVAELTFKNDPKRTGIEPEFRDVLTLRLGGARAGAPTTVGYVYLQHGLRWFPQYKVDVDGKGVARVTLQAALQNDLVDLEGVTVRLVVGVPSFEFQDLYDPIAMQESLSRVQAAASNFDFNNNNRFSNFASNAIMSQVVVDPGGQGGRPTDGPSLTDAERKEDLFVFKVENVTLKRGQRLALTIAEFSLNYVDIYRLDLKQSPPPDLRSRFDMNQMTELAKLLAAPKAVHKLRIENSGPYPLTTAPALILSGGQVLGQGLITYTSIGRKVDLAITTAVEIGVKHAEIETARTRDAATKGDLSFVKVEHRGTVTLTNSSAQAIEVEVTRRIPGNGDMVSEGGKMERLSFFEELQAGDDRPVWWRWWSWPTWWAHFNGSGRLTWNVKIEPRATVDLTYDWHYYWN